MNFTLKDVLWVPEFLRWLLGFGEIHLDRGEFVDAGIQRSYVVYKKGELKSHLGGREGFMVQRPPTLAFLGRNYQNDGRSRVGMISWDRSTQERSNT